jgi:hypothetical protein
MVSISNLAKNDHFTGRWRRNAFAADIPSPSTAKVSLAKTGSVLAHPTGTLRFVLTIVAAESYSPSAAADLSAVAARARRSAASRYHGRMNQPVSGALPLIQLKTERRSNHPWIFQKMVEKPANKPKPGSIVDIVDREGNFAGRGFYNGHSRIALRMLTADPDEAVDEAFFARKIAQAVALRRDVLKLDDVTNAYRLIHSEGDGLSGLVVDRFADTLVIEYFSAGMFRQRDLIRRCLLEHFPNANLYWFAEEHVQKQESFDCGIPSPPAPIVIPNMACNSMPRRAASTRPASSPTSATTARRCRNSAKASACSTCAATPAASASMRRRLAARAKSPASTSTRTSSPSPKRTRASTRRRCVSCRLTSSTGCATARRIRTTSSSSTRRR